MEKDVLQYIVIIVAAVIWVVSKVSKVKKNIDTSTPPIFTPQQSGNLDDWWKEISQEAKPVSKEIKVNNRPIGKVDDDYFEKLHKNYKNPEFSLQHKPIKQLEIIDNFQETEIVPNHLNINIRNGDEARRAFVYSEIFNRKY